MGEVSVSFDVNVAPSEQEGAITVSMDPVVESCECNNCAPNISFDTNDTVEQPVVVINKIFAGTCTSRDALPTTFTSPMVDNYQLNTGTAHRCFWLLHPAHLNVLIEDSQAMYLDITTYFMDHGYRTVDGVTYKLLSMQNAVPYNVNHKFIINASNQ